MVRISSHRAARSASFSGMKGVGETQRVSLVTQEVNAASFRYSPAVFTAGKGVSRRRS